MEKFDLCVIGAGSGGLSVAAAAAQFGEKVALFEKAEMGGDCLNTGCVPSKALIAAAKRAHIMRDSAAFGVTTENVAVNFERVHDHVHEIIATIEPHDSQERFEKMGVTVVREAASFIDSKTLIAGTQKYTARRFVIATGSSATTPPIKGLADVAHFTNENIFNNKTLPKHLLVIGGGVIGMELAQAYRRFGAEVTIIEAFTPLNVTHADIRQVVLDQFIKEGITLKIGMGIVSVSEKDGEITIELEGGETVKGSHLLVAAGRKANVEGLGLDKAGVAYSPRAIEVDDHLRTTNPKIYAIGDVSGGPQFTHVAGYQAGLVIRQALFGLPAKMKTAHIPWCVYTEPELAHVGISWQETKKHKDNYKTLEWHFAENDRAQAERETQGMIRVVTTKKGKIISATIVGPQAGELIQPWGIAISSGLKLKSMIDQIVAYPTLGEINRRVAISSYADLTKSKFLRFLISLTKFIRK